MRGNQRWGLVRAWGHQGPRLAGPVLGRACGDSLHYQLLFLEFSYFRKKNLLKVKQSLPAAGLPSICEVCGEHAGPSPPALLGPQLLWGLPQPQHWAHSQVLVSAQGPRTTLWWVVGGRGQS